MPQEILGVWFGLKMAGAGCGCSFFSTTRGTGRLLLQSQKRGEKKVTDAEDQGKMTP